MPIYVHISTPPPCRYYSLGAELKMLFEVIYMGRFGMERDGGMQLHLCRIVGTTIGCRLHK